MSDPMTHDDLMRFLDGELTPEEHERLEARIGTNSELARELAIFRAMKNGLHDLSFHPGTHRTSVWDGVSRKLTRPVGWLLISLGAGFWTLYGVYVFATGPTSPWQKLGTAAIVIGVLLLLASVIQERYREWLTDPYRDVHR